LHATEAVSQRPRDVSQDRVVLIECAASSARQWDELVYQLVGFDPLPFDLYGYGREHPRAGPLSPSAAATAIDRAGWDGSPFHLIGHSYGGGVALKFALGHPQRLQSLILVEPTCFNLLKTANAIGLHSLDEITAVVDVVNRSISCGNHRKAMAIFIDYWEGERAWASLTDERQTQLAHCAMHVTDHLRDLRNDETPLTAYQAMDVPTLILCGTHSPKPWRVIARILAETLPRARHRTIRNVSRISPITHSARVNAVILEYLMINKGCEREPRRRSEQWMYSGRFKRRD
jgi:pimeloyl-ACP methyl ester carboxylesterase